MQNKTISFETAEAAVMQTWKSLLKQTNPYLVPILLPMIEHFKPLFQEFYDLGVSHGRTAQAVPEGFKVVSFKQISELVVAVNKVDLMTHTEQKTNEARLAWQDIASKLQTMIEAQEPAND